MIPDVWLTFHGDLLHVRAEVHISRSSTAPPLTRLQQRGKRKHVTCCKLEKCFSQVLVVHLSKQYQAIPLLDVEIFPTIRENSDLLLILKEKLGGH